VAFGRWCRPRPARDGGGEFGRRGAQPASGGLAGGGVCQEGAKASCCTKDEGRWRAIAGEGVGRVAQPGCRWVWLHWFGCAAVPNSTASAFSAVPAVSCLPGGKTMKASKRLPEYRKRRRLPLLLGVVALVLAAYVFIEIFQRKWAVGWRSGGNQCR